MAQNLTSATTDGPAGNELHNAKDIEAAIQNACASILKEDAEIRDLTAKHLQPHRDQISAIKKELKKKKINWADVKPYYDLMKRKAKVDDFEDDDERHASIDNIRLAFDALSKGGQLDFVTALTGDADGEPDEAETADNVTAIH